MEHLEAAATHLRCRTGDERITVSTRQTTHFMEHPEVRDVLTRSDDLLSESDRGAVLIATEWVADQLERLFLANAPVGFKTNGLFGYPGVLSSLSARIDVAVLCRLISDDLGASIHHLRRLRNAAAHSRSSFRLRDHWNEFKLAFALGPGIPEWINQTVLEVSMKQVLDQLRAQRLPDDLGGELLFETPQAVLDYLHEHPGTLEQFRERLPRQELAIAATMMCALIIHYRDHGSRRLHEADSPKPGPADPRT